MNLARAYRRGAVSGLALGEVFLLLAFILMVGVLLIGEQAKEEAVRAHLAMAEGRAPEETREIVALVEEAPGNEEAETDPEWALGREQRAREAAEEEVEELKEKLRRAASEHEQGMRQIQGIVSRQGEIQRQLEESEAALEEARTREAEIRKRLERSARTAAVERSMRERSNQALGESKEENKRLKEFHEALARENKRLREQLSSRQPGTGQGDKGSQPPCWYTRVRDRTRPSGWREKAIYALSLRIAKGGMRLGRRPIPGSAGQRYRTEAGRIGLNELPYDRWLREDEVRFHLHRLYLAGQSRKVRSYPCWFSVQVWDELEDPSRWLEMIGPGGVIGANVHHYRIQEPERHPWGTIP